MTKTDDESRCSNYVVECSPGKGSVYSAIFLLRKAKRLKFIVFLAFVTFSCLLFSLSCCPKTSWAETHSSPSPSGTQGISGTLTDQITDTQNLLGSNVGAVSDAIAKTEETTGVHVRLLYLPSFYQGTNPDKWASQVLESSKPQVNTVLLAVASKDGNLVVAVSANSDKWLRQQSTVDDLSAAALKPIVDKDNPDWVGSAQALMKQVEISKQQMSRRLLIRWGIVIGVLILVLGLVGFRYWSKKSKKRPQHRHSKHSANTQVIPAVYKYEQDN